MAQLDDVHSVLRLNYETLRRLISLASPSVANLPYLKRKGLLFPRVEDRNSRLVEIAPVASDDRKPVVKGGRRKHEVRV